MVMEVFLLVLGKAGKLCDDSWYSFGLEFKMQKAPRCLLCLAEKLKIRWAKGIGILRPASAQPHRGAGPLWFFFYKRLALRNRLRGNSPGAIAEFWVMLLF